jgi:hypothetical protein
MEFGYDWFRVKGGRYLFWWERFSRWSDWCDERDHTSV